jgi:hypothetical protein
MPTAVFDQNHAQITSDKDPADGADCADDIVQGCRNPDVIIQQEEGNSSQQGSESDKNVEILQKFITT